MPTLVLPVSAYNLLRLLWSSQRVPTSACWSYLVQPVSPATNTYPSTPLILSTHLQPCSERLRCNNIQEEVSTLSSNLSSLDTLLPAFQGVSTLFSSLSTLDTPLPVLQKVSTLFSSLYSQDAVPQVLQVSSSLYKTVTPSPRSLPCVMLPTSTPDLSQRPHPRVS